MTDEIKRIIWAIDPFEPDLIIDPATIKEIAQWADEKRIEVEPVYVFSPVSKLEMLVTEKIEDQISSTLSSWNLHTRSPKAILNPDHTTVSAVNCLLSHAESSGAGLIMVCSHGRRGLQRMLFGSFAEALLATSKLPILFLNQHKRLTGASIKKALWATDFSEACEKAFDAFIHGSGGISNELLLFHDVSLPLEMNAFFLGWDVGVPPIDDVLEVRRFRARDRANEWIKNARELGIRVEKMVNDGYGNIKDEILSVANENKAGLIVMSSQTGPFEFLLLGSQARKVLRASEFPVWIYGPKFSEGSAARKEKKQNAHI